MCGPVLRKWCDTQGTAAAAGVTLTVKSAALLPEGGASDVGASVCKYAADQKVRGCFGGFAQHLLRQLGVCVHATLC